MPTVHRCLALVGMILTPAVVRAETIPPTYVPPEIGPLIVAADSGSGDVTLKWSGGTPPFTVVRADDPCFRDAEHVWLLGSGLQVSEYVDSGALRLGKRLHYQVYDVNSTPEAHWSHPDGGTPGDEITIRGAGFDVDCSKNEVYIAGREARVVECSFIHLVFVVPTDSITGFVTVATPTGAALVGDPCLEGESRPSATWRESTQSP